jgi:hypothetical protein
MKRIANKRIMFISEWSTGSYSTVIKSFPIQDLTIEAANQAQPHGSLMQKNSTSCVTQCQSSYIETTGNRQKKLYGNAIKFSVSARFFFCKQSFDTKLPFKGTILDITKRR